MDRVKKAYKGYAALEPGETIITKKKNASYMMLGRAIITIITLIMFVYSFWVSDSWWSVLYAVISLYYLYYAYTRTSEWASFNHHLNEDYFSSIDENEYVFLSGNHYGRLTDFEKIKYKM
tara:strand:+ start:1616 stop:1975 length:360 start_codon:yes stop_codon:yes gene_type:complete